ncbi:MAG TPA: DUF4190 domain-containing protein [Candidatus Limnocylindrales bacterium]|nr:DUF4190 domain-containing protein [Candidatus Limnocylindrales bacterium]
MFCASCGASLPDNSVFCSKCGRSTQGNETQTASPAVSAPAAGAAAGAAPAAATSAPPREGAPVSPWLNVPSAQPMHPQYNMQPRTDGQAIASLVLGIASVFLCLSFVAGIPAIVLGHLSRKSIRESMGRLKGDGMALAGLIMGYIGSCVVGILIIAAILIPNLLRARMAANDSAAAATVRTIDTAQAAYRVSYPSGGYAADLATLGSGDSSCNSASDANQQHACLIDNNLGNSGCLAGAWCNKGAFKYTMTGVCAGGVCTDYVLLATPINSNTGTRSFCSTSDGIVRAMRGTVLSPALTPEECKSWLVLN